jgi:hypothetical protein
MIDHSTVREFVGQIHDAAKAATEGHPQPGLLQLVAIHPDSEAVKIAGRYLIGDVDRMVAQAVIEAESGFNVYIEGRTVRADMRGPLRGSLEDTVAVFALVLDRDGDKNQYGSEFMEPTIRVETSPGNRHDWIVLGRAINADEAQKLGAEIRAAVGPDHDSGNPTQPYRVAGTPNYPGKAKRERGRTETHKISFSNGGPLYSAEIVWATAARMRATKPAAPAVSLSDERTGVIPRGVETAVSKPVAELGTDRSSWFYFAVCKAVEEGMAIGDFEELCRQHPKGAAQKYLKPDRLRKEIERVWSEHVKVVAQRKATAPPAPAGTVEHVRWLDLCIMGKDKKPMANVANTLLALRSDPAIKDAFAYNEMLHRLMLVTPLENQTAEIHPRDR